MPTLSIMTLAASLALAIGTQPAATPSPAQTSPPVNTQGITLESNPTRIDALGVTVFLPVGSVAETTSFGANATMGVQLPNDTGVMVIKGQRSTNADLTVTQVVDSIIDQLRRSNGRETLDGRIFDSNTELMERTDQLRVAGLAGERFYMRFPAINNDPELVRGFSVFRVEPRQFIVFDLMTEAPDFPAARLMYETSVGTMDLSDRSAMGARRTAAFEASKSVIAQLTPESIESIISKNPERWERLYTPARSGDEMDATEHGYRRLRVRAGVRGETTGKNEKNWRPSDRQKGYIVNLDAMAIEPSLRIDTRAVYFVSEDFKEESWTVSMALRQGDVVTESTVTGARSGTSMTVQIEQSKLPPTVTRPVIQGDGYVSQTLVYIMPNILLANAATGDFACYAYNPGSNAITMRWDTVEQPASTPDLWVVRSRPDEETPAARHVFNAAGELLRSELHNGRIWEPVSLDRLVNLWKRKGLPLE